MKNRSFQRLVFTLLLCGLSNIAAAETVGLNDGLATASARCGYDLAELRPMLIAASIDRLPHSGIKINFHLKSKYQTQAIYAQLSISCADPSNNAAHQSEDIPDAQAIIRDEDAGGRYFRHVASQKLVKGRNWRATVAVVDYVLGDAQQIRKNEILACNSDMVSPCISLRVSKPQRLSKKHLNLVYSMIEQIAVTQVKETSFGAGEEK
jgi:hypothetical protein